jgi:hypothetical protein
MEEVPHSGKHFSLLQYGNNYCRKKFYSTGPRREGEEPALGARQQKVSVGKGQGNGVKLENSKDGIGGDHWAAN